MRQAPSVSGSLAPPPPRLFGDGSSAAVSDSPQATGEGCVCYEYPMPCGKNGKKLMTMVQLLEAEGLTVRLFGAGQRESVT